MLLRQDGTPRKLCPRCKIRDKCLDTNGFPRGYCSQCYSEMSQDYVKRRVEKDPNYRKILNKRVLMWRKKWELENPEAKERRRKQLLRKYNLTPETYDELLAKQGGKCAICGTTDPHHKSGIFCVDHDHLKNKRRGLLCFPCNSGLGGFKDNPELLLKAASYLERFSD